MLNYILHQAKEETLHYIMEVLSPNSFTESHLTDVINICQNVHPIKNHQHEQTEDEISTQKMLIEQIVKNQREEKLSELERKLHRACDQMEVLMTAESRAMSRQKRAKRSCHGSALYTRQLEVNVIRGVISMYYQYAGQLAQRIALISHQMAT